MSYFCGILENELTFQAYKYAYTHGPCKKGWVSWGYDGFTFSPLCASTSDLEDRIKVMNEYVRRKTGFHAVCFIDKPYDPDEILEECIRLRKQPRPPSGTIGSPPLLGQPTIALLGGPEQPPQQQQQPTQQLKGILYYNAWKVSFEKEWCKIKNTASFIRVCFFPDGTFEKYVTHSEKQLKSAYGHECFEQVAESGKIKRVECIRHWLEDPTMRCYDDAEVYPPPLECPPNKFNLWRPYPFEGLQGSATDAEADADIATDAEGVEMFKNHLKILCNHDPDVFDFSLSWIAHSIQKPAQKPECMLTLVGKQGIGKNILTTTLARLYGSGKMFETTQPERDVWGSFNTPMMGAYLVVLNETDKRNAVGAEGKMKGLITDPPLTINGKGKDQFPITSYHRFITNSNTADPVKTSKGDRRNVIIRCSDEKKGD
jgi:hypothetical protein